MSREVVAMAPAPDAASSVGDLILAQVMLPADANPQGNVHGGTLMKLADTAGGTCGVRHARRHMVTVAMDSMTFEGPVYVGNLVLVHARVTWTGRTSLETEVTIDAEDVLTGVVRRISTSYFVYVALDEHGHPAPLPPLQIVWPDQERLWREASERRALRLQRRGRETAQGGGGDQHAQRPV